ncbi:hypothetical protein C8Q70DRAFT_1055575 [Cubamyces menziesii]|uniref:Uncharacterized protein n=1 Tax=Trametes cubensis TaxID=1111947 RepID=A0AAD7TUP4_9APHY|nr:hypothetical protein C8Q70DRAFT_1055575 [Cubamyces menziesii]KAJ8482804.1 hypothetical protein ONZ51_g5111 [Trametes cubensis]
MSDLAFNVWGVVTGVIGTLAVIIPVFLAWLRTRLPSNNLPQLIDAYKDVLELFTAAVRDGLFPDEDELHRYNVNIWTMTIYVDDIRSRVYSAQTWRQDASNWWNGLSGVISTRCRELNDFRFKLAERNSRERRRLASLSLVTKLPLMTDHKVGHDLPIFQNGLASELKGARRGTPQFLQVADEPLLYESGSHSDKACSQSPAQCGDDAFSGRASSNDQRSYHSSPDAELQDLLAYALSLTKTTGHRGFPDRREVLHALGRKLRHSASPASGRYAQQSRPRAFSRVLRRIYGVRPGNVQDAIDHLSMDPESLLPLATDGSGDGDGDVWEDL